MVMKLKNARQAKCAIVGNLGLMITYILVHRISNFLKICMV